MNQNLKEIIKIATHAPSADNCQPWRFELEGNRIYLFNIPERDTSLYSWGQRTSYIAHGALLENILIAAPTFGYKASVEIFPSKIKEQNPNLTITVTLEQSEKYHDPLLPFIPQRATNRKPYKKIPLTNAQRGAVLSTAQEVGKGKIEVVEDRNDIETLAQAVSQNEKVLFENLYLHNFFFSHINWTSQQDNERKIGFYIKTFEVPPPAVLGFKLAKNWDILQKLNTLGLSKLVAKINSKTYSSCSAMGIIVVEDNSPESFITAGRNLQRIWLKATKMGLCLQPVSGIVLLMNRILSATREDLKLSPDHIELIKTAYQQIKDTFGVSEGTIALFFRIGVDGKPSAHSLRLLPDITIRH